MVSAGNESEWKKVRDAREQELEEWHQGTALLAAANKELAEEVDEVRRSAHKAVTAATADLADLRVKAGVLQKEVEFAVKPRDGANAAVSRLQAALLTAQEATAAEVARCRLAETRVGSLEATLAERDKAAAEAGASSESQTPSPRLQRRRKAPTA